MRSKLLPSIDQLPTICEDLESTIQEEPQSVTTKENHSIPPCSSQSLDEYIKSIRHLAHPAVRPDAALQNNLCMGKIHRAQKTGLSNKQPKRVPLTTISERRDSNGRIQSFPMKRHNSLEDITMQFDNQANQLTLANCRDPFDLLFGHVQSEKPEQPTAQTTRKSSLDFRMWSVLLQGPKQTQTTKSKTNSVYKSLGLKAANSVPNRDTDVSEATEKRSRLQRFQKHYGSTSRGRAARLLKCTLPIIYEQ